MSKPKTAQQVMIEQMPESDLDFGEMDAIRKVGGWASHVHDSRHSEPGMLDVFGVLPGNRVLLIENKKEKGKFTETRESPRTHRILLGQLDVMEIIQKTGKIETYTMRPSEWMNGKMERILAGTEPQADIEKLREENKKNARR